MNTRSKLQWLECADCKTCALRRKRPHTDPRAPHKRSAPFAGHTLVIPHRCCRSCPDHRRDRGPPFRSPHDGRPPNTILPGFCTLSAPVLVFDWIIQLCIGLNWVRRWPRSSVAPHAALEPPTRQLARRCIGAAHDTHELPPSPNARAEALAGLRMCTNRYHTVASAPHLW